MLLIHGYPKQVESAIRELETTPRQGLTPDTYTVLVAPWFSPNTVDLAATHGYGKLDLSGNYRLHFVLVFLERVGEAANPRIRRQAASLFTPKSARILRALLTEFNVSPVSNNSCRVSLQRQLLDHLGDGASIKLTLRYDYGMNSSVDIRTFTGSNYLLLDDNQVQTGEDVQFRPETHVYAATYPLDANLRISGSAPPMIIGDGARISCRVVNYLSVTVGTGSMVTHDLSAGKPCRVIKEL